MIDSMIITTTLATGIKYPAAVTKAYAEQEEAAEEYGQAQLAIHEAEAELDIAKAEDQQALTAAAAAGTGHPGEGKTPAAARAVAYAHEVGEQVQTRYIAAAETMRHTLTANADEIVPLAIKLAREATENYDDKVAAIHRLMTEANSIMQNAAHSLNVLRPHIPYLNYSVNWVPAQASLPGHNQLGNITQVANQLEQALTERANPVLPRDTWPVPA